MRGTVRVVLNTLHFRRDAVFVATEIDHTVVVLMAAALVTGGDVAIVVTTCALELRLQQGRVGSTFVQVITGDFDNTAPTRRGGFHFDDGHDYAVSPPRLISWPAANVT